MAYFLLNRKRARTSLARRVVAVIRDAATQGINFTVREVRMEAARFGTVAEAVEGGRITVRPLGLLVLGGIGGEYNCFSHVITVEAENLIGKARVVHEAAHAMNDLAERRIHVYDDESAAYITGAWYYQMKTGRHLAPDRYGAGSGDQYGY